MYDYRIGIMTLHDPEQPRNETLEREQWTMNNSDQQYGMMMALSI